MADSPQKAATKRFGEEVFNQGKLATADELLAADVVDHDAAPGQPAGAEGIKHFATMMRNAFPDLQTEIDEIIEEGDIVAFRYTVRGTHEGEFNGIAPTGRKIQVRAMEFLRFSDGKMVDRCGITDQLGLLGQLGASPAQ
ncbi:MAG: ester cyclase [Actinomycetota bacterium]|nr:ester cyclase [Actinomycetota bacterium]